MTGFYYVYMLSDVATRTHHYVGMTEDIENRLAKHNAGQVPHTSKFAPWTIDAAIAVRDKTTAAQLERYLKSGSGRAFANKHLFATSLRSAKLSFGSASRAPQAPQLQRQDGEGECLMYLGTCSIHVFLSWFDEVPCGIT